MPNVYIPEIGDLWKLEQPWTFTLVVEDRNFDLWNALDGDNHPSLEGVRAMLSGIKEEQDAILTRRFVQPVTETRWVTGKHAFAGRHENVTTNKLDFASRQDRDRYQMLHTETYRIMGDRFIPVTLPAETVLRVDRIYIRKGNSDFSSLSFYIVGTSHPALGPMKTSKGFKKGRKRFFASLEDVNRLVVKHVATMDEAIAIVGPAPVGKRKMKIDD